MENLCKIQNVTSYNFRQTENGTEMTITYADGSSEVKIIPERKSTFETAVSTLKKGDNYESYNELLKHYGVIALLLCLAIENSTCDRHETGRFFLNSAERCIDSDGQQDSKEIIDVIAAVIQYVLDSEKHDEFYYQALFNKYAHIVIPGCKVIERGGDRHNQPDAWIELEGDEIPVEVKLRAFDAKALKQLTRYMNVFNKHKGVAVGGYLNVELPDNIIFVSNHVLDSLDGKSERERVDKEYLEIWKTVIEKANDDICNQRIEKEVKL